MSRRDVGDAEKANLRRVFPRFHNDRLQDLAQVKENAVQI
jgi:hypothetical protein